MASKQNTAPEGVFVKLFGITFKLTIVTERVVELKRGKKVIGQEVEILDNPYGRIDDPLTGSANVRGAGTLAEVGECVALVDGVRIPLTLVPGLTKTEDAVNKDGSPAKRNPKVDTAVEVLWNGKPATLRVGASQTGPNSVFIWGGIRAVTDKAEKAARAERELPNLSEFVGTADFSL